MNLKQCNNCEKTVRSYTLPVGWLAVAEYDFVRQGKTARSKGKWKFVDFAHLCPECRKRGFYLGARGKVHGGDGG